MYAENLERGDKNKTAQAASLDEAKTAIAQAREGKSPFDLVVIDDELAKGRTGAQLLAAVWGNNKEITPTLILSSRDKDDGQTFYKDVPKEWRDNLFYLPRPYDNPKFVRSVESSVAGESSMRLFPDAGPRRSASLKSTNSAYVLRGGAEVLDKS